MNPRPKVGSSEEPDVPEDRQLPSWFIPGLILLLMLGYGAFRLTLRALINNHLAALESQGYPTTVEGLDHWYTTPPQNKNAARVYLEAFRKLPDPIRERGKFMPFVGEEKTPPIDWRPDGPAEEHIRMYLAENSEGLELLHDAYRLQDSRYPIDLGSGLETSTPHLSELRRMVRVLELDAIMHAIDHRPAAATRSILDAMAAARSLEKEPLLISQTVRMDCQAIALDALQRVLSLGPLRKQDLKRLDDTLRRARQQAGDSLKRALVGQVCFMRAVRGQVDTSGGIFGSPLRWMLYRLSGLRDWDCLRYLDSTRDAIEACEQAGGPDVKSALAAERKASSLSDFDWKFTGSVGAVNVILYRQVERLAQIDAARTALAVERYRIDRGRLPEKLVDISPEYLDKVPNDPYDDGRLHYARREQGYVIYSVGRNGMDDGGKSGPRNVDPDIAFAVLR